MYTILQLKYILINENMENISGIVNKGSKIIEDYKDKVGDTIIDNVTMTTTTITSTTNSNSISQNSKSHTKIRM